MIAGCLTPTVPCKVLTGPTRKDGVPRRGALLVTAVSCLYCVWLGRPELAFAADLPFRSDLGGHMVALRHLIEESLPRGHLSDWSHQWFGGYPAFYFYFPLPAMIIVAGSLVLPLETAARLVAVFVPALLPAVAYVFVRACGYGRLHGACGAVAAAAYVTMTTQYIHGGNVLSSVIGEYSYGLGLALALLYLSRVAHALRGEQQLPALTLLLSATALSHVIPTMFAVAGSLAALRRPDAMRQVTASWVLGFAVAGFWALPFLIRLPFTATITWIYHVSLGELFPLPILMILPWTLAAAFSLRPYRRELAILALLAASAVVVYLIPTPWFARERALPVWHLALYLLAGIGIATGVVQAWNGARRYRLVAWGAGFVLVAGSGIIQVDLVRNQAAALLAPRAPDAAQYSALIESLKRFEPGRVHWEHRRTETELLGHFMALSHIPALVPGMTSTLGLLVDGALNSPLYFQLYRQTSWYPSNAGATPQPARENTHDERTGMLLEQLGVDYFVTFSDAAAAWAARESRLRLADAGAGWTLWTVSSNLVEPGVRRPAVISDATWAEEVERWAREVDDTTAWRVFETKGAAAALAAAPVVEPAQREGRVLASSLGHRTVRFTTSAVGVPHIVRVSYFPNWRAEGAAGPYAVVPGFMLVVPTEAEVVLRFQATWVERIANAMSVIGAVALLVLWIRSRPRARG
jgi:hypothetical protein